MIQAARTGDWIVSRVRRLALLRLGVTACGAEMATTFTELAIYRNLWLNQLLSRDGRFFPVTGMVKVELARQINQFEDKCPGWVGPVRRASIP